MPRPQPGIVVVLLVLPICNLTKEPQGLDNQEVLREHQGVLIQNQNIGLRFLLKRGSPAGNIMNGEAHSLINRKHGLIRAVIGGAVRVAGGYNSIHGVSDSYLVDIAVDKLGRNRRATGVKALKDNKKLKNRKRKLLEWINGGPG